MQKLNIRQDSSALAQEAHFMTSPRGTNYDADGPEPFRQINIDQIQNSSNGKHHLGNFRSPLSIRKNQSNLNANSQNSKNACESSGAASVNGTTAVQKFNTDLKIPMRIKTAGEQGNTGPDENTMVPHHYRADQQQVAAQAAVYRQSKLTGASRSTGGCAEVNSRTS